MKYVRIIPKGIDLCLSIVDYNRWWFPIGMCPPHPHVKFLKNMLQMHLSSGDTTKNATSIWFFQSSNTITVYRGYWNHANFANVIPMDNDWHGLHEEQYYNALIGHWITIVFMLTCEECVHLLVQHLENTKQSPCPQLGINRVSGITYMGLTSTKRGINWDNVLMAKCSYGQTWPSFKLPLRMYA